MTGPGAKTRLEADHVFDGDGNPITAAAELELANVDGVASLLVRPVDLFARTIPGATDADVNAADDVQVAVPLSTLRALLPPACTCDDVHCCPYCLDLAYQLLGFTVRDSEGRGGVVEDFGERDGNPTVSFGDYWARLDDLTVLAPPEGEIDWKDAMLAGNGG